MSRPPARKLDVGLWTEPKFVIPPPTMEWVSGSGEPEPPVIVRRVMAAVTPCSTVTTEPDLAPSSVAWPEPEPLSPTMVRFLAIVVVP
jgi:hypothetical protein